MTEPHPRGYFETDACDLDRFVQALSAPASSALEFSSHTEQQVPFYDAAQIAPYLEDRDQRRRVMAEWADILRDGAGILVLKRVFKDTRIIDQATQVYNDIIASEKSSGAGQGDHFAKAGANDRIWNSLQKLCEAAPDIYLSYFAQPMIDAVCEAWLGPHYQMTAQINLVRPGGQAQQAHRDYHLGFQSAEMSSAFPAHAHDLSPALTLQGGIAHCDMPIESGPTKVLPFSQRYRPGYAAWRRDDFRAYFEAHHVQLALEKGDVLFFSPALFHAAGANHSEAIERMVNLLQVSSAFGRAMETVDRPKMCKAIYPVAKDAPLSKAELRAAIAATAEGYAFPTNLDTDPPSDGLAPASQQALIMDALARGLSEEAFNAALDQHTSRRKA